jgi:hypothetical protein
VSDQAPAAPRRESADLAKALAADLRDLAIDLDAGSYTGVTLAMLQRNLHRAVPSALGACITVVSEVTSGAGIRINLLTRVLDPAEIAAALRIPLRQLAAGPTSVVLYAGQPGALEEIAVALGRALRLDPGDLDQHPVLPVTPVHPGTSGLHDFSVVNRAIGVLMNRGHTMVQARAELSQRAERSGTDLPAAAQALLTSIS